MKEITMVTFALPTDDRYDAVATYGNDACDFMVGLYTSVNHIVKCKYTAITALLITVGLLAPDACMSVSLAQ